MPHLIEFAVGQLQTWRAAEVHGLAATDLDIKSLVSAFDEGTKLVDREEVLQAIAEFLGHETRVIGKRLRGVLRLPASVLVVERLGEIPVIQRSERLDPGRLQLVGQAAVEIETLRVRLTRSFREDSRPGDGEPVRRGADGALQ